MAVEVQRIGRLSEECATYLNDIYTPASTAVTRTTLAEYATPEIEAARTISTRELRPTHRTGHAASADTLVSDLEPSATSEH